MDFSGCFLDLEFRPGSKHRTSTVVKNLRRNQNWFHRPQLFYVDVTVDFMSLR